MCQPYLRFEMSHLCYASLSDGSYSYKSFREDLNYASSYTQNIEESGNHIGQRSKEDKEITKSYLALMTAIVEDAVDYVRSEAESDGLYDVQERLKTHMGDLEAPILDGNTMYVQENYPQRQKFPPHIIDQLND